MKIIGIEKIDYIRKSDSSHIQGVKLYCGVEDPRVQGMKPEEVFISAKSLFYDTVACLVVGEDILVFYDKNGKVARIETE